MKWEKVTKHIPDSHYYNATLPAAIDLKKVKEIHLYYNAALPENLDLKNADIV